VIVNGNAENAGRSKLGGRCEEPAMMHGMNDISWGMGLIGLLVVILLVLGIAALVKYLFSSRK
jgi:hypothetical protein